MFCFQKLHNSQMVLAAVVTVMTNATWYDGSILYVVTYV